MSLPSDISEERLAVAKKMGANHTVKVDAKLDTRAMANKIVEVLGGHPDVTVECSGAESSLQTGIYVGFDLDKSSSLVYAPYRYYYQK